MVAVTGCRRHIDGEKSEAARKLYRGQAYESGRMLGGDSRTRDDCS